MVRPSQLLYPQREPAPTRPAPPRRYRAAARHADGSHASTADIAALNRKAPFAAQCRERGLTLAGAAYEYKHHAPDFLAAGGQQKELDALNTVAKADARMSALHADLGEVEQLVIQYAAQMTLNVKVDDAVFEALRQHFNTTELGELISAIATYNMVARFLVALGVSPEK